MHKEPTDKEPSLEASLYRQQILQHRVEDIETVLRWVHRHLGESFYSIETIQQEIELALNKKAPTKCQTEN